MVAPANGQDYKATLKVGMEIHVELATRTKMWTAAPNVAHPDYFDAEPNTLVDPIVIGMPGVLPVMNREALVMSAKVGLALNCRIAEFTKWDRKGYYYPDLPKNYQISQYDLPLCEHGYLDVPVGQSSESETRRVGITRAHLEEDAGKLMHEAPGGRKIDYSIVDLNRAGTPLLEIVTEPDLVSADHAVMFGQMLRNICRHLGVTEGIMQRGHMRFEPNINVIIEHAGQTYATPIVEIKNLNSFRALHGAIEYEYHRQIDEFFQTGKVMAERAKSTRGWDDGRNCTTHQRHKEDADEYRYFPDPDLLPVTITRDQVEQWRSELPELPADCERRFIETYKLNPADASVIANEPRLCRYFQSIADQQVEPKRAATILLNNLNKRANELNCDVVALGITPRQIAKVQQLLDDNQVSSNGFDQLLGFCCEQPDADPAQLAEQKGLIQVSDDSALEAWADQIIAAPEHAKVVADIRSGKMAAIGRLIGAVMQLSKGQANPKLVQKMLRDKLVD